MNIPIMLTGNDIINIFLGACGFVTIVAGAGAVIINLIAKLKNPNKMQNERLDKHEQWLKRHDEMLDNDNKRLKNLEEANNMILEALFALLSHGIDGNDTASMKKVKDKLNDYLIHR